jgi:hypothetical protein
MSKKKMEESPLVIPKLELLLQSEPKEKRGEFSLKELMEFSIDDLKAFAIYRGKTSQSTYRITADKLYTKWVALKTHINEGDKKERIDVNVKNGNAKGMLSDEEKDKLGECAKILSRPIYLIRDSQDRKSFMDSQKKKLKTLIEAYEKNLGYATMVICAQVMS